MDVAAEESIPGRENSIHKGIGMKALWHILGVVTGCMFLSNGKEGHCGGRQE